MFMDKVLDVDGSAKACPIEDFPCCKPVYCIGVVSSIPKYMAVSVLARGFIWNASSSFIANNTTWNS